jgi:hypothetical protein
VTTKSWKKSLLYKDPAPDTAANIVSLQPYLTGRLSVQLSLNFKRLWNSKVFLKPGVQLTGIAMKTEDYTSVGALKGLCVFNLAFRFYYISVSPVSSRLGVKTMKNLTYTSHVSQVMSVALKSGIKFQWL